MQGQGQASSRFSDRRVGTQAAVSPYEATAATPDTGVRYR